MTKKNVMPVVVLTVICLVVAALLALVNQLTAPTVEANAQAAINASLMQVLDTATDFQEVEELSGVPATVQTVYRDRGGSGFAVIVAVRSQYTSGDPLTLTVGISTAGKITGTAVTAYSETRDIRGSDYVRSFVGQGSDLSGTAEMVSGATYSSAAFKTAVTDAFRVLVDNGLIEEAAQ